LQKQQKNSQISAEARKAVKQWLGQKQLLDQEPELVLVNAPKEGWSVVAAADMKEPRLRLDNLLKKFGRLHYHKVRNFVDRELAKSAVQNKGE
jgi:hypothetical protein